MQGRVNNTAGNQDNTSYDVKNSIIPIDISPSLQIFILSASVNKEIFESSAKTLDEISISKIFSLFFYAHHSKAKKIHPI